MNYYVIDEIGNKKQSLDIEGIMALLDQAIKDGNLEGILADSAFVSKLKCCVSGETHGIAFVSNAKYNELVTYNMIKENTIYFIVDDTSAEDIDAVLEDFNNRLLSIDRVAQTNSNRLDELEEKLNTDEIALTNEPTQVIEPLDKNGLYAIKDGDNRIYLLFIPNLEAPFMVSSTLDFYSGDTYYKKYVYKVDENGIATIYGVQSSLGGGEGTKFGAPNTTIKKVGGF